VLREYAQLCGPVPMIPRYVLGPMVTDFNFEYFPDAQASHQPRFQNYNQQYLEEEISRLLDSHIPVDTLVLDFAWHNYGWDGGYDWSPLIPRPKEFADWLHSRGIKLSLNDHPGYINTGESILSFRDSHAPEVLKALGRPQPVQPSFDLDLSRNWLFSPDPQDEGLSHQWYLTGRSAGPHWKRIRVGLPWQSQGYPEYRGVGWYRTSVQLPAKLPEKLYLYLGEVGSTYRIFINGQETTHSQIHWPHRLTYTDVTSHIHAGRQNEIVLRVEPGERGGDGLLLGPVAIRDVEPPKPILFDLSNQQQAGVFMRDLHGPLMQSGVDFWWVDGGSGASDMRGLNKQLWTNKVFYDYSQQLTGKRAFILGRYGDWGSERYPGYFTGDTYSQWPVLAYEVSFTARGGNVLVPYISHDIGGFHGRKIDFDLYARWIEFGAFSPLLRMHSAHENPIEGNLRMPWVYGAEGIALMRKYFTLRTQLLPYLYTYVWRAHHDSEPILRPLYLAYPRLEEAYHHSREYFFGDQILVSPVVSPEQEHSVYLPPGRWFDFFSGKSYSGGTTFSAHYAVDQVPVFVRDGALIPEQEISRYSDEKPLNRIILNVYGTAPGRFDLYEDDGLTLAYDKDQYAITTLTYTTSADGSHHLVIEPTKGAYQGQPGSRSYELRIHGVGRPASISADGQDVGAASWDATQSATVVSVPSRSIRDRREIVWH
jgi:alpha-glucosidase (family GH31 glycosyl hydrolase)